MPGNKGFEVRSNNQVRKDAWLFGEAQSRVVVSVSAEQTAAFERFLQAENTPFEILGAVKGHDVVIDGENWGAVSAWKRTYDTVLGEIMA
jgi:phosphoribosylformylglycinamidine synthase